ncbi:hypothetical protein C2S52_023185 [Perilla frutescens var. hirtella]|nr:hypothetical protein C2S52_023185 [Perilla frutescens var. hirtella]
MQHLPPKISSKLFDRGCRIEARLPNDAVTWHPATFIRFYGDKAYVKFDTSSESDDPTSPLRREYVSAGDIRPAPPTELHRYFKVGETVEGFCGERKAWRRAKVVGILENSRYSVRFHGAEREGFASVMEQWELRAVRDWVDCSWNPPFLLEQVLRMESPSSSESEAKANSLKLKIKCSPKPAEIKFSDGMLVEVTSCKNGYQGSWFVAVIVKSLENDYYLVEYRTLKTANKTEFLREEVDASCIRYPPPVIRRVKPFEFLERVNAWYKGGWWEGHIVQVQNGCSYAVHFTYTNENMVFEHRLLRPHHEWIDGKWLADLKVDPTEVNLKPNKVKLKRKNILSAAEPTFMEGMVVEVRSDEEGYQGSWYTAEIVCSLGSDEFLVEYQTLKTDDESALLREKAITSYIRPCPTEIVRIDCYKALEEVDAWYNEGWWVGVISRVLDDRKYGVYFWTTNEEIIFDHTGLRTHQDWIGGKWTAAMRKKSRLLVNNRQVIYIGEHDIMEVEPDYVKGMKVEVKGGEHSDEGIWYPAIILKSLGRRKYLVQYQTLKNDDGTELYHEAFALCIRPSPPLIQRKEPFKPFEEVDAWLNNGWWAGQICKASPSRDYSVSINATNEILEFQHFELRPHHNLIQGQWVLSKRGSKS